MMSLLDRARASGRCPPSLLQTISKEDQFEPAVSRVLDANELSLSSGPQLVNDFELLVQMASGLSSAEGDIERKKKILSQRRCIILAIVGATPPSNTSLQNILQLGFLSTVKLWMDDVLAGSIGGVDLLLHLLTNITKLPVTKSVVKNSGMGKAIGSIEKHKICAGTPNESAIKERVKAIKEAWNKSVKSLKDKDVPMSEGKAPAKRELESTNSPTSKKARIDDKKSKFSSLLKRVNTTSPGNVPKAGGPSTDSPETSKPSSDSSKFKLCNLTKKAPAKKKQMKRVKWSDHFGGNLTASRILEGDDMQPQPEEGSTDESSVSWSDRRRRDRLREKELLAQAKKSKLNDDDDMGMDLTPAAPSIKPTSAWRAPKRLPERSDVAPPQVASTEITSQTSRMTTAKAARYMSERDVPSSPTPLSDVEQALDMTSQSSTVVQSIPFFVPQAPPAPAPAMPPAPMPAPAPASYTHMTPNVPNIGMGLPPPQSASTGASSEIVQTLGLPMFLVGQNVQALQTLASTPSLLSTFVDSNGVYDQARLTSLVQTLSQNIAPSQAPQTSVGHSNVGGYQQQSASPYGPPGVATPYPSSNSGADGIYGPASVGGKYGPASGQRSQSASWQATMKNGGYRGDQNNGDGNLHLGGYGPSTTQADIITLFAPYVKVDEVVMKGTFCFVNTSDPIGAKRAREALNGALLGGQPVRINIAQRKTRENAPPQPQPPSQPPPQPQPSPYGNAGSYYSNNASVAPPNAGFSKGMIGGAPGIHSQPQGQPGNEFENVRDDRGNPATKNLFVAGYGPGTTEVQIRDIFGQHAKIVGIIMKGTFSFVNTSDKRGAIHCREVLSGSMLNGGVLRINFAKETGRLGTSFDLTYGGGGGGGGGSRGGGSHSHYGRGF